MSNTVNVTIRASEGLSISTEQVGNVTSIVIGRKPVVPATKSTVRNRT